MRFLLIAENVVLIIHAEDILTKFAEAYPDLFAQNDVTKRFESAHQFAQSNFMQYQI